MQCSEQGTHGRLCKGRREVVLLDKYSQMMAVYALEQVKIPEEIEIMRYANQVRFVSRENMFALCLGVAHYESVP